jgi:hypothetical protein
VCTRIGRQGIAAAWRVATSDEPADEFFDAGVDVGAVEGGDAGIGERGIMSAIASSAETRRRGRRRVASRP